MNPRKNIHSIISLPNVVANRIRRSATTMMNRKQRAISFDSNVTIWNHLHVTDYTSNEKEASFYQTYELRAIQYDFMIRGQVDEDSIFDWGILTCIRIPKTLIWCWWIAVGLYIYIRCIFYPILSPLLLPLVT